jgi:hypothetical protein
MDSKGRWMDNVMIEQPWRSPKYGWVNLQAFETGSKGEAGIGSRIDHYNFESHHSALAGQTSAEALVGQRIVGITLGYEDVNDHDPLRSIRCWPWSRTN